MRSKFFALFLMLSCGAWAQQDTFTIELADSLQQQANAWFDLGDFPRAIQALKMRYVLDKSQYDWATDLGWMLENVEDYSGALAIYVEFRMLNPKQADHALPEAEFYFRRKLYAKVIPLLHGKLSKENHPNSWRVCGHSLERVGRLKDAQQVWESYMKNWPNDAAAKNNLNRINKKLAGE